VRVGEEVTSHEKRQCVSDPKQPRTRQTRAVEPAVQPVDEDGLPVFETARWRRALPRIGDRVWVCDENTGDPWRDEPGYVLERRGGVKRFGPDGKPRRPKIVEYLVTGYACWYPWHQLIVDPEAYP
jgi:hypothetical protein